MLGTLVLASSLFLPGKIDAQLPSGMSLDKPTPQMDYPLVFRMEPRLREPNQNPIAIFEPTFYEKALDMAKRRTVTDGDRNPEPPQIYNYVMQNKEKPLDLILDLLSNNQVLLFGEMHSNNHTKKFVTNSLETLVKHSPIKFLAVEIASKYQKDIDDFVNNKINAEQLKKRIYYVNRGPSADMIRKAADLGLRVIAVDGEERDEDMIKNLRKEVFDKNPDEKGIVYIGNRHLFESKLGSGSYLTLAAFLNALTKEKSASIIISEPRYLTTACKLENIPENIAFRTTKPPINKMLLDKDHSDSASLDVYYNAVDAIITVKAEEFSLSQ